MAFKLILPSNASYDLFPKNTSSHYTTRLHKPIHFEGQWEVAAESLYYSAYIGDEKEVATLHITANGIVQKKVNDVYDYTFHGGETWPGYEGIEFTSDYLLRDLNRLNARIVKGKKKLYEFSIHQGYVSYQGFSPYFTFEMNHNLAKVLKFNQVTFTGTGPYDSEHHNELSKDNEGYLFPRGTYRVFYFNKFVLQCERRIQIKAPGEKMNVDTFVDRWRKKVEPFAPCKVEIKKGKVVLHLEQPSTAIIFSDAFGQAIGHELPLIRRQTRWSWDTYSTDEKLQEDAWTVSIYNTSWMPYNMVKTVQLTYDFRPRLFTSISDLLAFLNKNVMKHMKGKLGRSYNPTEHALSFTLEDNRVVFAKGYDIQQLQLSRNLTHLLGFQTSTLERNLRSNTPPTSLKMPTQRVLLMTDFTEPISYGQRRIPLLQEFVHDGQGYDIIEKRFEPLSYVPVSRQSIDFMTIQLVNDDETPITVKDAKTVLVLHFRQV